MSLRLQPYVFEARCGRCGGHLGDLFLDGFLWVGCSLHHLGLQPASRMDSCSLHHAGLLPVSRRVAASIAQVCSLFHIGLQPLTRRVAASYT